MEKIDFLIEYLIRENEAININEIPANCRDKKSLYRSLCNIRDPRPISPEYIEIENEYLNEELKNKKITFIDDIKTISQEFIDSKLEHKNKICLWKGDITSLRIGAIVNAANSAGLGCFIPCHNCIDNVIHSNAGISLRLACSKEMDEIGELKTGEAFITKGYNLPANYVIHTVGPIIRFFPNKDDKEKLGNCYKNSLNLALQNNIRTIAFPCISTGEFRYPKKDAAKVAIKAVVEFLEKEADEFEKVIFNVYTDEDYNYYKQYLQNSYIKNK